ncbi:hypothetical protein [Flavobacterium sp. CGRL2]
MKILNETLLNISSSQDNVSKLLFSLYERSVKPSEDNLIKARYRKEIGNPPGKRNDPLGDQLSWEMLLDIIPKITNLWIISKDQDYYTENKDVLYLNPVLKNDLIRLNPNINIKVFNKLSEALRDFNNKELITSIPSKNDLDRISLSESHIENIDDIDLKIINYLSQGYGIFEMNKILAIKHLSLSQIEKRINNLKNIFNANNTIHLVSITKDMGII